MKELSSWEPLVFSAWLFGLALAWLRLPSGKPLPRPVMTCDSRGVTLRPKRCTSLQ